MTKIGKKLVAVLLALAMIVTFVPALGTQTAYADENMTSITLESKGDLVIPTAGAPITYPDIAKAIATVPAGYEDSIVIKYAWHDVTNNRDYFQNTGDTGVFTAGQWQLIIIVYAPTGYTMVSSHPFSFPVPLGGYDFISDWNGGHYYRIKTNITIPDNPDYGAPAIPSDTISNTYDTGYTLNKNIGALGSKPMTYSVTSGALPEGITLGQDGSMTGTFTNGGTYTFTITVTNDLGSASRDYWIVVNSMTTISDVTLTSNGDRIIPRAGAAITYPNDLSVSATTPSGCESILEINYAWYDDANNQIYFSSSGNIGTFTPGNWHLGFILSIPSDKRTEYKFDVSWLPGSISIDGTTYDRYSAQTGFVIYRTPYTIVETPLTEVSAADIAPQVYTGSAIKPTPVLTFGENTLVEGTDFTVSYTDSKGNAVEKPVNVGTYSVIITGKSNYTGTVEKTFKITPKKITPRVTLSASAYTWNGKVRKPAVTVKDGSTKLAASDYTVTYKNNKNVGKASAVVTLKGNYSGEKTLSFVINPKGTSLSKVTKAKKAATVKWKKQSAKMSSSRITGYQILLATNSKFTKNKKTVTVKGYKIVSKKVTGLKGGKKYYVKIRTYKTVGGTKYYSPWSKYKTVTTKK